MLPQYSGGLGILAGDHLKAASDLGVPLIGVGLLYRHGYFRQSLSRDGWQQERYPVLDPDGLPLIAAARGRRHAPRRSSSACPAAATLAAQVWLAQVGRVPLLLLDSDVEENAPAEREVTDRLYGGGSEHRLLPGDAARHRRRPRAARLLPGSPAPPAPEVFHTNEGHAGFLGLERIRELTERAAAWPSTTAARGRSRAGTVFTTHTPVPAGIDRFPPRAGRAALRRRQRAAPACRVERILALGAEDYPGGDPKCSTWP